MLSEFVGRMRFGFLYYGSLTWNFVVRGRLFQIWTYGEQHILQILAECVEHALLETTHPFKIDEVCWVLHTKRQHGLDRIIKCAENTTVETTQLNKKPQDVLNFSYKRQHSLDKNSEMCCLFKLLYINCTYWECMYKIKFIIYIKSSFF